MDPAGGRSPGYTCMCASSPAHRGRQERKPPAIGARDRFARDGTPPACPGGRARGGKDVQGRAVVSRVSTAAVTVDGVVVGEIGAGLLSLVGVGRDDDVDRARALARK